MIGRLVVGIGCLAISVSGTVATAEDTATGGGRVTLLEAQSFERTASGQLDACEVTYTIAFEDHIYRRGAISFLRGSVSLIGFVTAKDKPPAILLKVSAFDLVGENSKFSPLGYGFLSAAGQSYARKEFVLFNCEDGGLCIGYEALKYPELTIAIGQEFEINFNRAEGKSDVRVPVSFLRDKLEIAMAFSSCVPKLLNAVEQKFSE